MNRTFKCPICKKDVELINDYAANDPTNSEEYLNKIRLSNKRFHMRQHKIINSHPKRIERLVGRANDLIRELNFAKANVEK